MKNEKLSNLLGYYLLAAAILGVSLGYFVVRPELRSASNSRQQTAQVNLKIAADQRLKDETDQLWKNYTDTSGGQSIQSQTSRILGQLPLDNEEERFFPYIEHLALLNQVQFSSYQPQGGASNSAGSSAYTAYPATISVSGTYQNAYNFFNAFELGARFADIESFSITSGSSASTSALTFNVNLQAYYQKSTATAGGTK